MITCIWNSVALHWIRNVLGCVKITVNIRSQGLTQKKLAENFYSTFQLDARHYFDQKIWMKLFILIHWFSSAHHRHLKTDSSEIMLKEAASSFWTCLYIKSDHNKPKESSYSRKNNWNSSTSYPTDSWLELLFTPPNWCFFFVFYELLQSSACICRIKWSEKTKGTLVLSIVVKIKQISKPFALIRVEF